VQGHSLCFSLLQVQTMVEPKVLLLLLLLLLQLLQHLLLLLQLAVLLLQLVQLLQGNHGLWHI
jgi:hypothetical protein